MTSDHVWVAVGSDGTITAHDTQAGATNALRDDDGDVWIEEVQIQATERPPERSHAPEQPTQAAQSTPTGETGSNRRTWISPPSLTVDGTGYWNPWNDDPEAA